MKKKILLLIIIFVSSYGIAQPPFVFPRLLPQANNAGNNNCEDNIKVKDVIPSSCNLPANFCDYFPVIVEDFDYKNILPNNWLFNIGWTSDDNYTKEDTICCCDSKRSGTWLGSSENAYKNNISVSGGIAELQWKNQFTQADPTGGNLACGAYDYFLTGAFLKSLNSFREGIFVARLRIPQNTQFWPGFWLRSDAPTRPLSQEIDIFEFFPDDPSDACDGYGEMSTTIHGYDIAGKRCSRGAKFPTYDLYGSTSNFLNSFHYYTCFWSDFRIFVYLDNTLVFTGTKYYDKTIPKEVCHRGATRNLPHDLYYCADLNSTNQYNHINMDKYFPSGISPMDLIISNSVKSDFRNNAISSSSTNNYFIDYIAVYQPQDCNTDHYICTLNDFKTATGGTNFLTGQGIHISNWSNTCTFSNYGPSDPNNWQGYPVHLLAHDYIEINGDAYFGEGTYLRATTVPYSGYYPALRTAGSSPDNMANDSTQQHLDFINTLIAQEQQNEQSQLPSKKNESLFSVSELDNTAIKLYPNPSAGYLFVEMADEDFSDLQYIEIESTLGQKTKIEKSSALDISFLPQGFYHAKFYFNFGYIIVKSFVKQ